MAARRSKRIVTSESPDSQTDTQHLSDQDDESEPGDDASMLDEAADKTALSAAKSNNSQPSTSTRAKPPAGGLKVRLKLANPPPSSPTLTPAAPGQRASSSRKREVIDYTDDNVNEDDLDELEDRPVRGSKRQKSNPDISSKYDFGLRGREAIVWLDMLNITITICLWQLLPRMTTMKMMSLRRARIWVA